MGLAQEAFDHAFRFVGSPTLKCRHLEAIKIGHNYRVTIAAVRKWLETERVKKGA